jgi:hypothetical protein
MNRSEVAYALLHPAPNGGGHRRRDQQSKSFEPRNIGSRQASASLLLELPPGLTQAGVGKVISSALRVPGEALGVELDIEAIHASTMARR